MELLIFVSLYLHDTTARHNIDKSDATVIGCDHCDILIKEIDSSHFAAARELAIIVFDFNSSLEL